MSIQGHVSLIFRCVRHLANQAPLYGEEGGRVQGCPSRDPILRGAEGQCGHPLEQMRGRLLPARSFEACGSRAGAGAGPVGCSVCCWGPGRTPQQRVGAGGGGAGWAVLSILWDSLPADLVGTERQAGRREDEGEVLDGFSITGAAAFIFVVVRSLFSDGTLTED